VNAVNKSNLMKSLMVAWLAASPMAEAEMLLPLGDEPAPVFEDQGLVGRPGGYRAPSQPVVRESERNNGEGRVAVTPPPPPPAAETVSPKIPPPAEPGPAVTPAQTRAEIAESKPESNTGAARESSFEDYAIGSIILALAGMVFWNARRSGCETRARRSEPAGVSEPGVQGTGVARYIGRLEGVSKPAVVETGVARYLKSVNKP
jgi:hypothetical protein